MPGRIQDRQSLARRARDEIRWLTIINTLDEEIPPNSFVGILDVDLQGNVYVGLPQEDGDKLTLVTYEFTILIDGSGEATNDWPWWVAYDFSEGTPARGEKWGPKKDSFLAHKGMPGFLAIPMTDSVAPPYDDEIKLVFLGLEYCRP